MAITYPLALPTVTGLQRLTFRPRPIVGKTKSPFNAAGQTQNWGWDFALGLTTPPLKPAEAAVWIAFLAALDGPVGYFEAGDSLRKTPRGSWGGTPKVDGAHAAGATELKIKGLPTTITGAVKLGDYIQLQAAGKPKRLHFAVGVSDFNSDGSGKTTVDIRPPLREALAGDEVIVYTNPVGTWRLVDNQQGDWESTIDKTQNILGFEAEEYL